MYVRLFIKTRRVFHAKAVAVKHNFACMTMLLSACCVNQMRLVLTVNNYNK